MARQDKRPRIMQAAERLFTSRRLHEITLDDVAQIARVGKGTIYRYFQDKDDLFFQTATSGFDELCELLRRQVPPGAAFTAQLVEACRQISGFFDRRRQLFRMMQAEEGRMNWCRGPIRTRWLEKRKALVAAVAEILDKGVADGLVRGDIRPDVLASLLLGMLRTRTRELSEPGARHCSLEKMVEIFCAGAGALKGHPACKAAGGDGDRKGKRST
jgi:AcrR family transcriptional regulator